MTLFNIDLNQCPRNAIRAAVAVFLLAHAWVQPLLAEGASGSDLHSFRWKLRGSAWFALVAGDFETNTRLGNKTKVNANDDLEYTQPYISAQFEGALRHGRHDFWVVTTIFNEKEQGQFNRDFEFDDVIFPLSVPFETKLELVDVNFRYGYSVRTIEEDGYRIGPYVGLSYTEFTFSGQVTKRPIKGEYEDTFPVPTFGAYGEIPYGKTLLSANLGGIWFESGDFEGLGFRGQLSATYRFRENLGLYGGLYAMYVDLDFKDEKLDDLILWGPNIGLELRF